MSESPVTLPSYPDGENVWVEGGRNENRSTYKSSPRHHRHPACHQLSKQLPFLKTGLSDIRKREQGKVPDIRMGSSISGC